MVLPVKEVVPNKLKMVVKVYTSPSCPYCFTLKEFLKENNIKFEEIDVSKDEKAKNKVIKRTGKMEVPMIEIGDEVIVGFDREKICKALNINEG